MNLDSITLQTLRDRITENTKVNRKLADEIHLNNLLKLLELNLIKKEQLEKDEVYSKIKKLV